MAHDVIDRDQAFSVFVILYMHFDFYDACVGHQRAIDRSWDDY